MKQRRTWLLLAILTLVLFGVAAISLSVGAAGVGPGDAAAVLLAKLLGRPLAPDLPSAVILAVRLPRLLAALLVGAGLAVAGLIFQGLLRNGLAEPYTLGISSGAAVGALTTYLLGVPGPIVTPLLAFVGALATVGLVVIVARPRIELETDAIILAGIIVNALFSAVMIFLLAISAPNQMHSFFFWLTGNLGAVRMSSLAVAAPPIGAALLAAAYFGWELNALAAGEEIAGRVGIRVAATQWTLFLLGSLLTALVVSFSGTIGFIGLVVPHLGRLLWGSDHRALVWICVLLGGAFTVVSDTVARTVLAPQELPIGVVTAFVGAPFFIALVWRRSR
ncbi:MAG TPA: iron ABC transporter permease [Acidobacteriota bacterium]